MNSKHLIVALIAAVSASAFAADTYAIDPNHTYPSFEADHMGISVWRGKFGKTTGTIELDRAAKTGALDITIDTTSISTGFAPLDTHLKSDAFFDVAKFPTIKFVGDKFEFTGSNVTSVAGMLTMHGQTHPVTLKASHFNCYDNPMLKRQVCGGDFEATIARTQWGVNYGAPAPVSDNVKLVIQIEAIKQ